MSAKDSVFAAMYGSGPLHDAVEAAAQHVLLTYGVRLSNVDKINIILRAVGREGFDAEGMYCRREVTPDYVGKLVYAQSSEGWNSGEFVIISQTGTVLEGIGFIPGYEGQRVTRIHLEDEPNKYDAGKISKAWTITRVNSSRKLIRKFAEDLRAWGRNYPDKNANWVRSVYEKCICMGDMLDRLLDEQRRERKRTEKLMRELVLRQINIKGTLTGRTRCSGGPNE